MADKQLQPLQDRIKIVNDDGTPTQYFIRWAQQRQMDIQDSVTAEQLVALLNDIAINEGGGISISGSLAAPPIVISLDAILNDLNDVDTVTTPPTNGQALVFDLASGLWKPGSVASGGGGALPVNRGALYKFAANYGPFNASAAIGIPFDTFVYSDAPFSVGPQPGVFIVPAGVTRIRVAGTLRLTGLDTTAGAYMQIVASKITSFSPVVSAVQFAGFRVPTLLSANSFNVSSPVIPVTPGDMFALWIIGSAGQTAVTVDAANSHFGIEDCTNFGTVIGNDPTLYLIHDQILASAAATYDVTNIPQQYEDLVVMVEARQNTGGVLEGYIRFNNDSTVGNYDGYCENRFGTTTQTDKARTLGSEQQAAAAGVYAISEATIFGYAKTNRYKNWLSKAAYITDNFEDRGSGSWKSNAAITSLRLFPASNSFDVGTRIRVYGRKPSIAPVSSGGGYSKISTTSVAAGSTLIDIQNIPDIYQDLILVWNSSMSGAAANQTVRMRFNNNNAGVYDWEMDSRFEYNRSFNETWGVVAVVSNVGYDAEQAHFETTIYSYAKAVAKSWTSRNMGLGGGNYFSRDTYGRWRNNAAVTSIQLIPEVGGITFGAGTVELYGRG